MENPMHFPGWREAKAVGIGGDDLKDFEGAFSARVHLSRGKVNLQISGVKPDLHSYFPRGELHSNPFFDCLSSLGMSGGGFLASSIKEPKMFVESGKKCLSNGQVSLWFKTHHEGEQHLVGDEVGGRVVQKLSHRQEVCPFHGLTLAKDLEVGL